MKCPTSILLALIVALLVPAVAQARPGLGGAKLQAASGTLTIKETRCTPGASDCGTAQLDEAFDAKPSPSTRAAKGRSGFPQGLTIRGKGRAKCYALSPPSFTTGPDGSAQFIGSAARIEPASFSATRVAASASRRGLRVAWLEPVVPSMSCDYFDEPSTTLSVPSGQTLEGGLVSRTVAPAVLRRSRFSITIAGSQGWNETASDGTQVTGSATWKLRLDYAR